MEAWFGTGEHFEGTWEQARRLPLARPREVLPCHAVEYGVERPVVSLPHEPVLPPRGGEVGEQVAIALPRATAFAPAAADVASLAAIATASCIV